MLCLSSLYFFALKSVGKGSVPQIIYTLEIVIVCSPQQLCLWSGGHLEHVLVEVLLLLLIVPEPLENELTEVRKIYETLPENNNSRETVQAAGWFLLGDVVGDVDHLLLRGVEAEHLHGWVQVLQHRALTRNVVLRQRNNKTRPFSHVWTEKATTCLTVSLIILFLSAGY